MMGNCEKMLLISSSSNQWPQNQQIIDHNQKGLNLMGSMDKPAITTEVASSGSGSGSDHHQKQQQKQPQEPLRCPRCDSSNTKFCYYNNYSLSQPRYFCKACKRYWTKGGTLRNVPVGGGCRKNNRRIIKRPNNSNIITNSSSSPDNSTTSSSSTTSCVNPVPILFGLPTNSSSDLNHLPFSGFDHLNSRGSLGFSPANIDLRGYNLNGFSNVNSSSLISGYSSLFGNPSSSSLTSLLGSKFTNGGGFKDIRSATAPTSSLFQNLAAPFDQHEQEFHVMGLNGENQVKLENGMKKLEWEAGSDHHQHNIQTDQLIAPQDHNDPNSLFNSWSSTWHDPTNLGSSIPSLI